MQTKPSIPRKYLRVGAHLGRYGIDCILVAFNAQGDERGSAVELARRKRCADPANGTVFAQRFYGVEHLFACYPQLVGKDAMRVVLKGKAALKGLHPKCTF